jgi:hypothetical protein
MCLISGGPRKSRLSQAVAKNEIARRSATRGLLQEVSDEIQIVLSVELTSAPHALAGSA